MANIIVLHKHKGEYVETVLFHAFTTKDACVIAQNLNYPGVFRHRLHIVEKPNGHRMSLHEQRCFLLGRKPNLVESWAYEPIIKIDIN